MKKKKIILLVIIIGIISIIAGGIFAFSGKDSNPQSSEKESTKEHQKPDKSYKTITTVEKEEFKEINKEDFSKTTKEIGFKDTKCENGYCVANKKTYENYEAHDTINISYTEDGIYAIGTYMYYHEKDYDIENVVSNLNSIINNYIGYIYTSEYLNSMNDVLQTNIKNDSKEDNFVKERVYVGEYTLETIINYTENFYVVKTFLIRTADYM